MSKLISSPVILIATIIMTAILFGSCGSASDPNVKVVGIITDKETGKPVAGARVADNTYCGGPRKACQEAWTDEEGRYVLQTWYEEHTLVVSAPGYPPKLVGLMTKVIGQEEEVEINVVITKG